MDHRTFMSQVYGFCTTKESGDIELAYQLAKKFHQGQFRKELGPDGKPLIYFEHPRRVALKVINAGITDSNVIIGSLFHDVVEDSKETWLTTTITERLFGPDVATLVRLVSKVPKEGYIERFRAGLPTTYGRHAIIKAADRLDNLQSLPDDPKFIAKQKKETVEVFLPIFFEAETYLPPTLLPGFRSLVGQIREIL